MLRFFRRLVILVLAFLLLGSPIFVTPVSAANVKMTKTGRIMDGFDADVDTSIKICEATIIAGICTGAVSSFTVDPAKTVIRPTGAVFFENDPVKIEYMFDPTKPTPPLAWQIFLGWDVKSYSGTIDNLALDSFDLISGTQTLTFTITDHTYSLPGMLSTRALEDGDIVKVWAWRNPTTDPSLWAYRIERSISTSRMTGYVDLQGPDTDTYVWADQQDGYQLELYKKRTGNQGSAPAGIFEWSEDFQMPDKYVFSSDPGPELAHNMPQPYDEILTDLGDLDLRHALVTVDAWQINHNPKPTTWYIRKLTVAREKVQYSAPVIDCNLQEWSFLVPCGDDGFWTLLPSGLQRQYDFTYYLAYDPLDPLRVVPDVTKFANREINITSWTIARFDRPRYVLSWCWVGKCPRWP